MGKEKPGGPSLLDVASICPKGNCESSDGRFNERCAGLYLDDRDTGEHDVDVTDHPLTAEGDPAAWFPTAVSKLGYYVNVRDARATTASDKENSKGSRASLPERIICRSHGARHAITADGMRLNSSVDSVAQL